MELKRIYTASTVAAAESEFETFAQNWSAQYPAMIETWRNQSLNSRFRHATRRRAHFPDEQSALKVLYLAAMERQHNRPNPTGQISGWKSILNTLAMTYGERLEIT